MVIKNVDSKRPQIVARAEVSKVAPATVKQQEGAPESGFQSAKMKLINMSGARPKVQLKGNPELLAYVKTGQATGGTTAKPKMPGTVSDFLKDAISNTSGDLKKDYEEIKKCIEKGNFTAAAKRADALLSGKADDKEEAIDADLGISGTKSTKTMTRQLDFLAAMEKAGAKPAPLTYPPTEAQLTDYFSKLKDDPNAARAAFANYTQAFHVHPANAGKGSSFDLKYGDGNTRVPDDWSEVADRPIDAQAEHIGKQMNDCEGFAFMAEKLLGAAGFTMQNHLTAHGAPAGDHAMVSFKHPSEKSWTVTSNDKVFTAKTEREGAEKGFEYASGAKTPKKTQFFQGKTMLDSQDGSVNGGKHI